jgi:hypothetical protein
MVNMSITKRKQEYKALNYQPKREWSWYRFCAWFAVGCGSVVFWAVFFLLIIGRLNVAYGG